MKLLLKKIAHSDHGFWEDLDVDRCIQTITEVFDIFLTVFVEMKTLMRKVSGQFIYTKTDQLVFSQTVKPSPDLSEYIIFLNIKEIHSYANLILVFIHELSHLVTKPNFGHDFETFLIINAWLLASLYYLIGEIKCKFNSFPEWNKLFVSQGLITSKYLFQRVHLV